MYTADALLDLHGRTHQSLQKLLVHCRTLSRDELDRKLDGFGYPSVRLQLHHAIGAEEYWIGVLKGRLYADDDDAAYGDVPLLEAYRQRVFAATEGYLHGASAEELNTARPMLTWGNQEKVLTPAHVVARTLTHIYQHQGQILAMCRLMEKPGPPGLDFPLL